jgi:hypothetical protein
MARPQNLEKTKQNLQPKTAPDAPGLTQSNSKAVSVRLHKVDIEAIEALDGDRSYHIRQAVKEYLEKHSSKS